METQISDVILLVDGEEVSLTDFIKANVIDAPQITLEELQQVVTLAPGANEWTYCGIDEVKRLK